MIAIVKKAWELGKKQCKIVVFDWLEDCLLDKKLKKGLRHEGPYTLDRTIARIKKGFTDHAEYRRKFEEGARASKALVDNSEQLYRFVIDLELLIQEQSSTMSTATPSITSSTKSPSRASISAAVSKLRNTPATLVISQPLICVSSRI